MATVAGVDMRRHDVRDNIRANPFVMSSKVFTYEGNGGSNIMDDKGTLLFLFPTPNYYHIYDGFLEIDTTFDGTPTMTIGNGTVADKNFTDGDNITIVDADSIATDAVAIPGTGGKKRLTTVASTPLQLVGAASSTPCIYITLTASSAVTQGKGRLHLLVCEFPEMIT